MPHIVPRVYRRPQWEPGYSKHSHVTETAAFEADCMVSVDREVARIDVPTKVAHNLPSMCTKLMVLSGETMFSYSPLLVQPRVNDKTSLGSAR